MEHEGLRSANRWLLLAAAALLLAAGALSWTKRSYGDASPPSSGKLLCTGALSQPTGTEWPKQSLEFTFDYGPGMVSPIRSDIEALNAPLQIDMDAAMLKAAETQPRPSGGGNMLRVSLQVSRQTGRFTLRAETTRESSGALMALSVWEGTCEPATKELKF